MSNKPRLPYQEALDYATAAAAQLARSCARVELASSLRRQKETVGDIEIVCIPRYIEQPNLFGEPQPVSALNEALAGINWKRIKGGDSYRQYDIGPCYLDLFITTPDCWGVIYALRTGSAAFSKWLVTPRRYNGACPGYLHFREGRIWSGKKALQTPDEGIPWTPVEHRDELYRGQWGKAAE